MSRPCDEGVLDPVHKKLAAQDQQAVWGQGPKALFFPAVLFHGLNHNDEEESEQVKAFPHVAATHLEKVLLVERLEHATLDLNEVVGYHDGQQSLVGCVDCHVETSCLYQHQQSVSHHVDDGQKEVGDDPSVVPFSVLGLGGCPKPSLVSNSILLLCWLLKIKDPCKKCVC